MGGGLRLAGGWPDFDPERIARKLACPVAFIPEMTLPATDTKRTEQLVSVWLAAPTLEISLRSLYRLIAHGELPVLPPGCLADVELEARDLLQRFVPSGDCMQNAI